MKAITVPLNNWVGKFLIKKVLNSKSFQISVRIIETVRQYSRNKNAADDKLFSTYPILWVRFISCIHFTCFEAQLKQMNQNNFNVMLLITSRPHLLISLSKWTFYSKYFIHRTVHFIRIPYKYLDWIWSFYMSCSMDYG